MEWYYTVWKNKLAKEGLTRHYKILPKEKWFIASVKAGVKEIKDKHPTFDFNKFKITYINSISEALSFKFFKA